MHGRDRQGSFVAGSYGKQQNRKPFWVYKACEALLQQARGLASWFPYMKLFVVGLGFKVLQAISTGQNGPSCNGTSAVRDKKWLNSHT